MNVFLNKKSDCNNNKFLKNIKNNYIGYIGDFMRSILNNKFSPEELDIEDDNLDE